jgi:hypothetical protein
MLTEVRSSEHLSHPAEVRLVGVSFRFKDGIKLHPVFRREVLGEGRVGPAPGSSSGPENQALHHGHGREHELPQADLGLCSDNYSLPCEQ